MDKSKSHQTDKPFSGNTPSAPIDDQNDFVPPQGILSRVMWHGELIRKVLLGRNLTSEEEQGLLSHLQNLKKYIEECHRLFLTTRNPLWAWDAWRACRRSRGLLRLPQWVFYYFDEASNELFKVAASGQEMTIGKQAPDLIATAMGLSGPKGTRSRFSDYYQMRERVLIVLCVETIEGATMREKYDYVAKEFNKSADTIQRIYLSEKKAMKKRAQLR